ncbi:hypothetical protein F4553_003510 [Allocatelliglobosispora scoriae]|uniref:Choice-of-anchor D domain-containing protein n=1 Tax=Allocatelliglobosispora scoriae TaxID=643052 RepID=A0A841BTM2_9ACTN|nr:choice-of-anchor D domain-containing protein [Allocatelliglobosispora scoriae]MBB5870131.1 hypothetical protein [Allocatelliglobosispora scoriae]
MLAVVIVASLTGFVPAAANAAGPPAPFTALVVDGNVNYPSRPTLSFDTVNSSIETTYYPAADGLMMSVESGSRRWSATVRPPVGTTWTTKTYSVKRAFITPADAWFDVTGDSQGCNEQNGTMTVHEVVRDAESQLVGFAASFDVSCESFPHVVVGEIRWNSSVGYIAPEVSGGFYFATQSIGIDTPPKTVTFTNRGSLPLVFGASTMTGTGTEAFRITTNTCSRRSLAYAESCEVTVIAHPTSMIDQTATLTMADNTVDGDKQLSLMVQGANTRSFTASPTSLDFGTVVAFEESPEQTITVTGTDVLPVTLTTVTLGSTKPYSITANTCANVTLAKFQTCTIRVRVRATTSGVQDGYLRIEASNAPQRYVQLTAVAVATNPLTFSPPSLAFGFVTVGSQPAKVITMKAAGPTPVVVGTVALAGAAPSAFTVSADTCSGQTLAVGASCTVTVIAHPPVGDHNAELRFPNNSIANPRVAVLTAQGIPTTEGTYKQVSPQRILDTRTGSGAPKKPIGAGATLGLQVTGRGGVPASGVSAVVLNVTVAAPTAAGYLTVFPSGQSRPTASSINFARNWTGANLVTVGVGPDGKVNIFNSTGATHVIADVLGYYLANGSTLTSGGEYHPMLPARIFDSRSAWQAKLAAGETFGLALNFGGDNWRVRSWAVNITAVAPGKSGYLTAWNGLGSPPPTSSVNFGAGKVVPNMAIVPTADCTFSPACAGMPMIGIYNGSPAGVHVIVDIVGYYDDGTAYDGLRFRPRAPARIVDTRTGIGTTKLGKGQTKQVTAPGQVAADDAVALVTNLTAVAPTRDTYLTVWPSGVERPTVSNINPSTGQTVANSAYVLLNNANAFSVYNADGTTNALVDVVGEFVVWSPPPSPAAAGLQRGPRFHQPVLLGVLNSRG